MMSRSGARLGPSRNGSVKMSSLPPPPDWPGANGPSKQATIWLAASGRQPWATGTRPVRPNIAAARRAVTSPNGPSPRTIGVDSASSVARIFAGLTNDSDDGRASVAVRSRRSASSDSVSWLTEAMPRASAASSAGVACAQTDVRDEDPPTAIGTCTPWDRAHTSASGESAAPTVTRNAPRRAASAARARVPAARPDCDTAITTSRAPTHPGREPDEQLWTGSAARDGLEEVGHSTGAACRCDDDAAWLDVPQPVETGLSGGGHRAPHLRPGPGEGAERLGGVEGRQGALVIEAGLVEHGAHRAQPSVRRARSTRRTGTPPSTG